MNTVSEYTHGANSPEQTPYREGPIARRIEKRTAKLPSDLFLWAAGAAIVASLTFEVIGLSRGKKVLGLSRFKRREAAAPLAQFVGLWVPSLLLLGVYNKIVKVAGSDRSEKLW